jgi:cyanophycinase-like exopeptidase
MLQILEARPELLGISIDEDTALVVSGMSSEVIGRTYVAFYVSEAWQAAPGRVSSD